MNNKVYSLRRDDIPVSNTVGRYTVVVGLSSISHDAAVRVRQQMSLLPSSSWYVTELQPLCRTKTHKRKSPQISITIESKWQRKSPIWTNRSNIVKKHNLQAQCLIYLQAIQA